jgi:hypothetical protein
MLRNKKVLLALVVSVVVIVAIAVALFPPQVVATRGENGVPGEPAQWVQEAT